MRRVAEYSTGGRFLKPKRVVRVDLHGVSSFGPGDQHTLIRWERIEDILVAGDDGVEVVAATERLLLPAGSFGLAPGALAEQLRRAADRGERGDVIDDLAGDGPSE